MSYQYFMRPEPMEGLGPIQTSWDPFVGREMRWREAQIGMVRNDPNKKTVTVYLDPIPHLRIEKPKPLQGWYQASDRANPEQRHRPRPCYTEAILTEPYGGGCPTGCRHCYINAGTRGYRGSGLVTVPINYGGHVHKMLSGLRTATAGYFSSFTDPFMALEDYYHNTKEAATAFVEAGLPVFFLSRLAYPKWAMDLLMWSPYSYAQKSINTSNPLDYLTFSPGALSLTGHLAEIKELRQRGIYVSIQVNPVVPGITTPEQIEELFELLAKAGANHVIVKFVEAGFSWAGAMIERMAEGFGEERAARFAELFTDNIGGQRSVMERYRLTCHTRWQQKATQLGLTYSTCYEYAFERGEDGEILSHRGYSLGPRFTTSDQCHGQRVPMFTRRSLSDPFEEVKECPPSGCLYCDPARCGSELFGAAKALRLSDLKKGVRGDEAK